MNILHPDFDTLEEIAAMQFSKPISTISQLDAITPRWLCHLLNWVPVESGVFRLNKVRETGSAIFENYKQASQEVHRAFISYEENAREYKLHSGNTILEVQSGTSEICNRSFIHTNEQFRLAIECVKEHQESELINNPEFGLLNNVASAQTISKRTGPPTPDDLDELLSKVWKQPTFFLLHPQTIATFARECTRKSMMPPTVSLFGSQFLTWRGIPLLPSDKMPVEKGMTKILLLRTGETRQGVVGLYQPGLPDEQSPGLSIRYTGIDDQAIASYLVSVHCSLAILADDAAAVLENVELGNFHP
jgi:hypothetical protein